MVERESPLRGFSTSPGFGIPLSGLPAEKPRIADVRSPREFSEDHIPGSRNVPLFDDLEHSVIGTLFRHLGPQEARAWGEERVHAQLEGLIGKLLKALDLDAPPTDSAARVICCARGGERSRAVANLLRSLGFPVEVLEGGYRSYRRHVRESLGRFSPRNLVVLDGLTGCGKTRVLREVIKIRAQQVIDLEGAAEHRSSLLGDIGLNPVSQKCFESRLHAYAEGIEERPDWVLVEGESRKVGDREIPPALWHAMEEAPRIELTASKEERVELLCQEYLPGGGVAALRKRLPALTGFDGIGASGVARLDHLLAVGKSEDAARLLLESHYDPRYLHGNRDRSFFASIAMTTARDTALRLVALLDDRSRKKIEGGSSLAIDGAPFQG